jgi:hypothetical protein
MAKNGIKCWGLRRHTYIEEVRNNTYHHVMSWCTSFLMAVRTVANSWQENTKEKNRDIPWKNWRITFMEDIRGRAFVLNWEISSYCWSAIIIVHVWRSRTTRVNGRRRRATTMTSDFCKLSFVARRMMRILWFLFIFYFCQFSHVDPSPVPCLYKVAGTSLNHEKHAKVHGPQTWNSFRRAHLIDQASKLPTHIIPWPGIWCFLLLRRSLLTSPGPCLFHVTPRESHSRANVNANNKVSTKDERVWSCQAGAGGFES